MGIVTSISLQYAEGLRVEVCDGNILLLHSEDDHKEHAVGENLGYIVVGPDDIDPLIEALSRAKSLIEKDSLELLIGG
jgi:hypothetical protein